MEGSQIWEERSQLLRNHVNNANHPDSESTLNRGSGDNSNRTLQDRSIEVGFRIQNLKNRNCQLDIVCHVKKVDDNQNNINAVQSQSNNSNSSNQNVANNSENNNIIQSQGSNSQQRNNDQTICLGKISDVLKKKNNFVSKGALKKDAINKITELLNDMKGGTFDEIRGILNDKKNITDAGNLKVKPTKKIIKLIKNFNWKNK